MTSLPKLDPERRLANAPAALRPARLSDVAPIFNLVQGGCMEGAFNRIYLQPRYQAGLALQLFGVCLMGRIRLPGALWCRARLQVLSVAGQFAGFALVRQLARPPLGSELYMCAIEPAWRRQGLGRQLLRCVQAQLAPGELLVAECLPNAAPMKQLLRSAGFKSVTAQGFTSGTHSYAYRAS